MNNYQLGCVCHLKPTLIDQWCDGRCNEDERARHEVAAHVHPLPTVIADCEWCGRTTLVREVKFQFGSEPVVGSWLCADCNERDANDA